MKISLIVTSYNQPGFLRKALLSANSQSLRPDEAVVADDGSSADIAGMLRTLAPSLAFPVRCVTHADRGFRAARTRNNGARIAGGDFLVFADQDIVFTKNYIKTFVDNAREKEFLVSWPVRLTSEQTDLVTDEMITVADFSGLITPEQWAGVKKQHRKDAFYRVLHRLRLRPIGPKLRSGVLALFKEDFMAVNGFDEMYKGWGNEDDDLGWRLYSYGAKGRNVTTIEVPVHLFHPTNSGGTRPNKEYYKKRIAEIRKGDYRCEYGMLSPLDDDRPVVLNLNGDFRKPA
ncbi:glycosyltransferase [bacterium]|nr:MAG: glycosyltransferase [bacterium]